jgi:hypothetical protein
MDMNQLLNKAVMLNVKRIALAISLASPALFPIQASAQELSDSGDKTNKQQLVSKNPDEAQLSPAITADNLDDIYREMASNSRWENLTPTDDFYQSPYQYRFFHPKMVKMATDYGRKPALFLPMVLVSSVL